MDITRGEFDDFTTTSSSRTTLRTESSNSLTFARGGMGGSMQILPPEEGYNMFFMSEEISDSEQSDGREDVTDKYIQSSLSTNNKKDQDNSTLVEDSNGEKLLGEALTDTSCSIDSLSDVEDLKLKASIEKMKKYDRILLKKTKWEKEVKRQRLLFQKQLLEELSTITEKNETTVNVGKYLALMPPPDQVQELLDRLDKDDFVPIFPTQIRYEDAPDVQKSPASASTSRISDAVAHTGDAESSSDSQFVGKTKHRSHSAKSARKGKTDFIKRNIELARDAGNYISMTDDEKKRLNELIADLDELEEDGSPMNGQDAFMHPGLSSGEGYLPDDEHMKRLTEIDERIQSLLPPEEFEMICSTPHISGGKIGNQSIASLGRKIYSEESHEITNGRMEAIQERLENIDDKWRKMYEGTTPHLSDEELEKLLEECSVRSSSRLTTHSTSTSLSSLNPLRSDSHSSIIISETDPVEYSVDSVVPTLSREILDSLLNEARSCLGLIDVESNTCDDEDSGTTNSIKEEKTPLFHAVERKELAEYSHLPPLVLDEFRSESVSPDIV